MTTVSDLVSLDFNVCELLTGDGDVFPCNSNLITVSSMGIATGCVSLLFVLYLIKSVSMLH
jgi:hypothetical protein